MKVINRRPWAVEVAHQTFTATVEAGGTVEVPDVIGESLVAQQDAWQEAPNKATTAADKKGR